ncbi:MAG TPA: VWA domain-containing protein [Thermoanaerobaculia bacterium]|nr:VWA domain-containing protein [Thermoanaerobaculia bacterium]
MKPETRRFAILCALLLALGSFFVAGAGAQKPAAKPAQPTGSPSGEQEGFFMDTVNVNVVNVDVYVTDKSTGKRVTGLTKDDFEIFENGRPIQITNFYAVEDGTPVKTPEEEEPAPQTAEAAPGAPAPATVQEERAPLPEDQRLRLVVYIDNFNLRPFNRNRVMRELRAFIGTHLHKGDEMMLVTYDRELHVRRAFTSDPSLIAAALLELEKVSAQAVHQDSDRRDVMRRIEDSQSATEAEGYARNYAQSVFNDLSFSIDALKEITNALAGMPGRKAIFYVSDGIPMISGHDVFYAVQNKYGERSVSMTEAFTYDASRRLQELTAQANANRITFYTIEATGLRVYDSNSAENQGPGPSAPGLSTLIDSVRISNLQSPLQLLAERTGGMAVLNANKVTPYLERIADDFGSYYSLGYTPPHYGDGRFYKIEVKVKKKGLVVRHREGYRDKSTEARMSDSTLAALNFPYEDNPLGVSLEFGPPQARQDGFYVMPLLVRIPLGKLVLVPREQTHEAKVRVFVAAMDSSGNTSEVQQAPVPISIPNADVATATGKDYVYSISLLMRPGEQRVAIGVRDDVAGEASFLSRGVRVGGGSRPAR